jgi:hypothetical protein
VLAFQEHQPNAAPEGRDPSVNANPATMASAIAKSFNSDRKLTPPEGTGLDHATPESLPHKIESSFMTDKVASTSDLAFKTEANGHEHGPDSLQPRRRKSSNGRNRSSVVFGSVDVRRRLIELWHQSLATRKKSRNWTAFSHLNSAASKKAAYTAETNQ